MSITDLWEVGRQFGPPGMLLAYMVWDKIGQRKIDKERIAADIQMATALTLLTAKIDNVR